jgi:hypothetical protein
MNGLLRNEINIIKLAKLTDVEIRESSEAGPDYVRRLTSVNIDTSAT